MSFNFPQIPLTLEETKFLNYIMEPTNELKVKLDEKIKKLPKNYTIQHFRFKDETEPDEKKCEKCYKLLENTYTETDILMSNSKVFKNYVKNKKNIYMLNCDECLHMHVGINPESNIIEFGLIEYYIITKSKMIHTYSQYWWISGFVYWPANFYNIEIKNFII